MEDSKVAQETRDDQSGSTNGSDSRKSRYKKPELTEWGSLVDLTKGPNFVKAGDMAFGGTGGV